MLRLEGERDAAQLSSAAASAEAQRLGDQIVQLRAALDDETRRFAAERQALSQAATEAEAQALASRVEIAALKVELTQARAEWDAERKAWECSSMALQTATGLWVEQSSAALQRLRSEREAAVSEREQAIADRDRIRADLAARLHAWDNSPWRKFRAFFIRALGKSAQSAPTINRLNDCATSALHRKGAYQHRAGEKIMQGALAPVEQHEQQDQRASCADGNVEESGLRQCLKKPGTFAGYRA